MTGMIAATVAIAETGITATAETIAGTAGTVIAGTGIAAIMTAGAIWPVT